MSSRPQDARGGGGWRTRPATAAVLIVTALLLFTWPLVRTPRLDLAESYVHLLGVWAALVCALLAVARALRPRDGPRGDRA